jgi:hypothetical protein
MGKDVYMLKKGNILWTLIRPNNSDEVLIYELESKVNEKKTKYLGRIQLLWQEAPEDDTEFEKISGGLDQYADNVYIPNQMEKREKQGFMHYVETPHLSHRFEEIYRFWYDYILDHERDYPQKKIMIPNRILIKQNEETE